jgi:ribosome-associated protein
MDIRKLQKAVVDALEDIKAHDIEVFDVTHLSPLFDCVIIASADSTRQVRALAQHVEDKARALGGRIQGVEGTDGGEWVLIDLGDLVVHVMQPAVRAHYNLEELWDVPKPRKPRAAAGEKAATDKLPAAKAPAKKVAAKKAPAKRTAAKKARA